MNKKVLFWIFLIVGICWILGVSYWYINEVENLDFTAIKWNENFTSKDPATQAFFRGGLWVIIPLLVTALIFYCIGLFFGKKVEDNLYKVEQENEHLKNQLAQQVNKIETMKTLYTGGVIERRKKQIESKKKDVELKILGLKAKEKEKKSFLGSENKQDKNKNIKKDNLKVIEGIGERIEFFLNENGIYTWEQLAATTEEKLRNILLVYGGASYKIHDSSTWPKQADLARQGKWEELNDWKEKIRK